MVAIPSIAGGVTSLLLLLAVPVTAAPAPAAEGVEVTTRDPGSAAADGVIPAVLKARASKLGGVDMVLLCHEQWGPEWRALRYGNSANDWKCWNAQIGYAGSVSVDAYCKKHFGSNAYASAPGGGINDWGCYRN